MKVLDEKYSEFRLFNKDILIKVSDKNQFNSSPIVQMESSKDHDTHFFTVLAANDAVTEVEPGQTIVLHWKNAMVPFLWGEEYVSVTNEDQIDLVLDED